MPGRNAGSGDYRYGMNGMEKDNEVNNVTGSSYTATFWQYDARLGRRWNRDPVMRAWESDYATFGNNPISNIDPNGDDWYKHKKTGVIIWREGSYWRNKDYERVGEFRTWNNITNSPGEWVYWDFAGKGDAFWWARDGALEGGVSGPGYLGGEVGWSERGGKELFFGTIGAILSGGSLAAMAAEGATVWAIGYETYQLVLSVDDISTVFYKTNKTALTELGISQDKLETLKTASSVFDFTKGLYNLIDDAAKNPDLPADVYQHAETYMKELKALMDVMDQVKKNQEDSDSKKNAGGYGTDADSDI